MKCFGFLILAASLIAPCSAVACETYTVTLVSAWTNNTALGADTENVRFGIDGVVQSNKHRSTDDEKGFWHFHRKKSRRVDLTCLKDQQLGTSFTIELDAIHDSDKKHIGNVTVTLQDEDGELRLAFDMKHGERTRHLRRRYRNGDETLWVTRVVPADGSANYNYVLRFQIETTLTGK